MAERIQEYINMLNSLAAGHFDTVMREMLDSAPKEFTQAIADLAQKLQERETKHQALLRITERVNSGFLLEDILNCLYEELHEVIPYDRIGLSLLEDQGKLVRSVWLRSDMDVVHLGPNYVAKMENSSLLEIVRTGMPRILNDLQQYLEEHPGSATTRLILMEGLRSSLTCPLFANGEPVGFLFFSSKEPGTYRDVHVEFFQEIAAHISVIIEKGRLTSELEEKRLAMEAQNLELQRLSDLKNFFLGMAAHDLRSPLSVVQVAVDLLLTPDSNLTEEQRKELLQSAGRQTEHMLSLVRDLLDLAEFESGNVVLQLSRVLLPDIVRVVVRQQQDAAKAKNIEIEYQIQDGPALTGDPARLRQAVENLVSNAVKYGPSGGKVVIQALSQEVGGWKVSVRDQGPGIKEEEKVRLFQPFSRLSSLPTGGEKSTGLGLAITRWIVEAHGGEVGVDTHSPRGSTFWFTLPEDKQ